jgi:1-acyl-sn-glycerol-3-phosphate acyltransferase
VPTLDSDPIARLSVTKDEADLMAYRRGDPIVTYTPRFVPFLVIGHGVLAIMRFVNWSIFGFEVRGRKNLQGVGPAILVSNHSLALDPPLIAHAIRPRRTYFTMLEETALVPLLGTFVRLLGGIPLPHGSGAGRRQERGIDEALHRLGLVHFFPEGECYLRNQQVMPFQRGAFHAACRRGLPVIPITTVLRTRAWRVWHRLGLPPRTLLVIGEPLRPSSGSRNEEEALSERAREIMQAVIDREGGCKTMGRGAMPRLAVHKAVE